MASLALMNARAGGMYVESPAVGFFAVELGDCAIAVRIEPHFDESESLGFTARAVANDAHPPNGAVGLEQRSNLCFGGSDTDIPDENIFHFAVLSTDDRKIGAGSDEGGWEPS
jgi:hypothetical protein